MPQIKRKQSESKTVGFKLDDENCAKLAAQAEDLGTTRNLLARDMVLRAMDEPVDLTGAVVTLNQQLFALREELALIAEVLLTRAGTVSADEAKKWADENIKPA